MIALAIKIVSPSAIANPAHTIIKEATMLNIFLNGNLNVVIIKVSRGTYLHNRLSKYKQTKKYIAMFYQLFSSSSDILIPARLRVSKCSKCI